MDDTDSDVFILAGCEDLVPLVCDGRPAEWKEGEYMVKRYIPRTEGSFMKIERYLHPGGDMWWKVTDGSDITTINGQSSSSRLSSYDGKKIFEWYPEFSFDNLGNAIEYIYDHEGIDDLDLTKVCNRNRVRDGKVLFSGIYLLEARYGNRTPYYTDREKPTDYRFITRFQYSSKREDAFSMYRAGFEVRVSRLCKCIKNINVFPELPGGEAIVSSEDFTYTTSSSFSLLESVFSTGYTKHSNGLYTSRCLPATRYTYRYHSWNSTVQHSDVTLGEGFVFTDLYNEGIPGLLSEMESNWYYRRNLGGGVFSKPLPVGSRPSFSGSIMNLSDLDSDGCRQLVNLSFEPRGFFEMGKDGSWGPMKFFDSLPNASFGTPESRMIDLTGDGKADLLVCEDDVFTWFESEGRKGFTRGENISLPLDEESGAKISFTDASQTIFLADMSGDGLVDIVRVRNSEVCYWPNLGYGKFGSKVTLDNCPTFAEPDRFNPTMVRFADIDGSGPSDIIYLGNVKFECWFNRCGSSLSEEPYVIDGIPEISQSSDIDFVDFLGKGTMCMVFTSSRRPGLQYIDLMSAGKPHIMTGYSTGTGKTVRFSYSSSVRYYLEDMLSGNPWKETLPFPVQCLESVETQDLVTGLRFVSRFSYHNGYYDNEEREFRGFGMVEQTDTEEFEKWSAKDSSNYLREDLHQKPVITRTWFHTGSVNDRVEITVGDGLDRSILSDLDTKTWKEAHRAARGTALRQTVHDSDGNLYSETTSSVMVQIYQPSYGDSHAVLIPLQKESFSRSYECGDLDDPRISHSICLDYDERGDLLSSVSIVYPRRKTDTSLPENISKMQKQTHISLAKASYTNDIDTPDCYRNRVSYLSEGYVLENVPKKGEFYTREDFTDWMRYATLASRSTTVFYSDDLKTPAGNGFLSKKPFQYCNYVLAFTPEQVRESYGDKVTDEMMLSNHYQKVPGYDGWWISSGRAIILEDNETVEDAMERFYAPALYQTVLGATTRVEFSDRDHLLISSVTDTFGNQTKVLEFDYQTLSPKRIEDINGNISETVIDELGMVIASAVMGKGDEADTLEGFDSYTSLVDDELVKTFFSLTDYTEIEKVARKLLRGASARYVYRTDCYELSKKPLCSAVIVREQYNKVNPDSPLQISYGYSSGMGGTVLSKVQAEAADGSDSVRWIGNGRTILNNKGNAVMQYEPYFADTPEYEDAKEIVERGITPVIHYDALGRAVRTDMPDGTYTKVEFDAWKTVSYDAIDTVEDSDWRKAREQADANKWDKDALSKSLKITGTPTVTYFDSLGRNVYTVGADGMHGTSVFNRLGDLECVIDSRENTVVRYTYDLLGNYTSMHGMDDGSRWIFLDAAGASSISWDQRGHRYEHYYDIAGRPTYAKVIGGDNERLDNIISRVIYAEDLISKGHSREELRKNNLLGLALVTYDTSGRNSIDKVDFAGRVLEASLRLTKDYIHTVNWIDSNLESALQDETFISQSEYDALGRVTRAIAPNGDEVTSEIGRGGMPKSQTLRKKGQNAGTKHIKSIVYNEKRQRMRIVYGNDVSVKYTYDPLTYRIQRILSSKKNGEVLQDLNYFFDAAGNITHLVDDAVPVEFNSNKRISGDSDYTYDSSYRLIKATGRENNAALREAGINEHNDKRFCSSMAPGDPIGLRTYTEHYTYDCAGNILQMKHVADNNCWTRDYEYASDSNRLLSTKIGDTISRYTYHKEHGFMTSMPHLSRMDWNFRDEMSMSSRQATDEAAAETTYYCYDGSGQRTRKIAIKGKDNNGNDIIKDERIYIGPYEIYRVHSGVHNGLERTSISLSDDQGQRYVIIETRNDIDDGTEKSLTRYQHSNVIGSASLELDDNANIISYEEYHPYGTTSYQASSHTIKAAAKRYKYTGMERDDETGLAYHTARYYIPWLGRWASADPISIAGGINLYCYCENDPIGHSDTNGCIRPGGGMIPFSAVKDMTPEQRSAILDAERVLYSEAAKDVAASLTLIGGAATVVSTANKVRKGYKLYKLVKTAQTVEEGAVTISKVRAGGSIAAEALATYQTVDDVHQAVLTLSGDENASSWTASFASGVCNSATDGNHEFACGIVGDVIQTATGLGANITASHLESTIENTITDGIKTSAQKRIDQVNQNIEQAHVNINQSKKFIDQQGDINYGNFRANSQRELRIDELEFSRDQLKRGIGVEDWTPEEIAADISRHDRLIAYHKQKVAEYYSDWNSSLPTMNQQFKIHRRNRLKLQQNEEELSILNKFKTSVENYTASSPVMKFVDYTPYVTTSGAFAAGQYSNYQRYKISQNQTDNK